MSSRSKGSVAPPRASPAGWIARAKPALELARIRLSSWFLRQASSRFRQAAGTYLVYGAIYWVTALYLQLAVFPARGPLVLWFGLGSLLAVGIPWLLWRRRVWFERWILSRRDLTRILAVLVALRALAVARIALGGAESMRMPSMGGGVPTNAAAAWVMAFVALATAVMLARAAWGPEENAA